MKAILMVFALFGLLACSSAGGQAFSTEEIARFDKPWAMTFLPDGRVLVTQKGGQLILLTADGATRSEVSGVPTVDYGGQGGLGDVVLHPDFESNRQIYLSFAEAGDDDTRGAAVAVARLQLEENAAALEDVEVIWRQVPKVTGRGHYGHRLAFDDEGYLFISSGERQKFDPSQDMNSNLGKIVRLHDDGSVPEDNPFSEQGGVAAEVWTLGQRNPLGIAFDAEGRLWSTEMGPKHGDELNLIIAGRNYGYPLVSNGDHYSGKKIPDHDTRPDLEAPKEWWDPTIAPGGLMFYDGEMFSEWNGSALIPGLASEAIIRVAIDGDNAKEVERFDMGERIRAVHQGPDGALWVLEDGEDRRLLRLTPRQ